MKCNDILLDTGAGQSHTGKTKRARSYNGITQSHLIARVVVQEDGWEEEFDVLVADHLTHAALLG